MQGWFAHFYDFLPNDNVLPVFVGTHFRQQTQEFLRYVFAYYPSYFQYKEIGCRDLFTLQFCQDYKIKSYFSRCLTLSLPKRDNTKTYQSVFFVDIPDSFMPLFPQDLTQNAVITHQRSVLHHNKHWDYMHKMAQDLLLRYKNEAKLVITTALHCAAPCTAMGIPVILLQVDNEQSTRFSALHGILKIHTLQDLKENNINFNQQAPDIEELKTALLENLKLSILKAQGETIDIKKLSLVREKIRNFQAF